MDLESDNYDFRYETLHLCERIRQLEAENAHLKASLDNMKLLMDQMQETIIADNRISKRMISQAQKLKWEFYKAHRCDDAILDRISSLHNLPKSHIPWQLIKRETDLLFQKHNENNESHNNYIKKAVKNVD